VPPNLDTKAELKVHIGYCKPGHAPLPSKVCKPCASGKYSLLGDVCLPCPEGATCTNSELNADGLPVGTPAPVSNPGFWLHEAPTSILINNCPQGMIDFALV
jgi:hypothetical protein